MINRNDRRIRALIFLLIELENIEIILTEDQTITNNSILLLLENRHIILTFDLL